MGCIGISSKSGKLKHTKSTASSNDNHRVEIGCRNDHQIHNPSSDPSQDVTNGDDEMDEWENDVINSSAQTFTLQEVADATDNFKPESYLGRGGFGKVYEGYLVRVDQKVAIKQLDHSGMQGTREFIAEVVTSSSADYPNLVKLIGCCVSEDQRLLIYEYMPLGLLDRHLFDRSPDGPKLDWGARFRIAAGAAKGLEYLHEKMTTIYRDLKCSNYWRCNFAT